MDITNKNALIIFFDDQNLRKCPQKKDKQTYVYSSSYVLDTYNDEFWITTNNTGYAALHPSWHYDIPCDTSMQKNGDNLYYAGGNDGNFTPLLFEVYAIQL